MRGRRSKLTHYAIIKRTQVFLQIVGMKQNKYNIFALLSYQKDFYAFLSYIYLFCDSYRGPKIAWYATAFLLSVSFESAAADTDSVFQ